MSEKSLSLSTPGAQPLGVTEEREEPEQWIISLEQTPIRHFSTLCDPELLATNLYW